MNLPDEDHVMRHVSFKRLMKDENGNPIGFLPEAFKLKEKEKGLSVNWLEYFKGSHQLKIEASVNKFRETRDIKKSSAFGIAVVKIVQDVCDKLGATKVRIVLDEQSDNKSHSIIIRLPKDDLALCESLAVTAFIDCVYDSQFIR